MSPSVHETSHRLLCEALGRVLVSVVESGAGVAGSVEFRAVAALYGLLMNHPVDRRGRCRSCRRAGAVLGWRRRRCQVRVEAAFWVHQPDEAFLRLQLAREFGLTEQSRAEWPPDSSPPLFPGGFPGAGRPDSDHGGAGEFTPDASRPRRGPSGDADGREPPAQGQPLLLTGTAA